MTLYEGTIYTLRTRNYPNCRKLEIHYKDELGKRKRTSLNISISNNKRLSVSDREKVDIAIAQVKDLELEAFNKKTRIVKWKKDNLFLIPFINRYIKRRTDLRPASAKKYKHLVNHIKATFGKNVDLIKLNESDIEGFKYHLLSKLSPATADQYLSALKTVVREAVKQKLIDTDITQYVKGISIKRSIPKYLNIQDVKRLIDTECDHPETKRAFIFACYTGLRFIDLYNLTYSNIKEHNSKYIIELKQKKTNYDLIIPLNSKAVDLILPIENPRQRVFILWKYDKSLILLREWAKKAGINQSITFHTARHTFATTLISAGTDIYTVSKLLGHTDIKHTQIYARVVDKVKDSAVELLEF